MRIMQKSSGVSILALPLLVVVMFMVMVIPTAAQTSSESEVPRTSWGTPDLGGVWDYRTITPLERPEEYGDQAFLT